MAGSFVGRFKGFVRDTNDPENRFRVRCFCPQAMGPRDDPDHWLGWAEAIVPWAGGMPLAQSGPPFTKAQNGGEELILSIEFENGELDFPVWTGVYITAATTTSQNAQATGMDLQAVSGGSLLANAPAGSAVAMINPPGPQVAREMRLVVKKGEQIYLGVAGGGAILLTAAGASIMGTMITQNGKLLSAATPEEVSD